jgi:hypothetical protein
MCSAVEKTAVLSLGRNRDISILMIKKKTPRLTLPQEATEKTKQGETKNQTKNEKHTQV